MYRFDRSPRSPSVEETDGEYVMKILAMVVVLVIAIAALESEVARLLAGAV